MKKINFRIILMIFMLTGFSACDLTEELREDLTQEEAEKLLNETGDATAIVKGVYDGLNLPFQDQAGYWAAAQHTTDETLGPTRGPDWDDGGIWRTLHNHTWSADHNFLNGTFTNILQVVFTATNALTFDAVLTTQQKAEVRFIRAFCVFSVADGWGQVPYREAGGNLIEPSQVLSGTAAMDLVISELTAIIPDLPAGPARVANKDAARVLLMKAYLNKGTFADRQNPTFPAADMTQVITYADAVIASTNNYSLDPDYFDNFAPTNDVKSSENIWTLYNETGVGRGGGNTVRSRWFCGLHYNMQPSGWNGFATLSDFYNSFEPGDERRYTEYPGIFSVGGVASGFLVGQQYDKDGVALMDRKGNQLAFTPAVSLVESGNNLEITGIRVMKYPIDYTSGDNVNNDLVVFRFADVLLMKAEALLRTGQAAAGLTIVNNLRTTRGATALGALTLDNLLAERGRELYWEGWRREDLIRFGKFLNPRGVTKPAASGPERLLFAIPSSQLAVNPNLEQNPGY